MPLPKRYGGREQPPVRVSVSHSSVEVVWRDQTIDRWSWPVADQIARSLRFLIFGFRTSHAPPDLVLSHKIFQALPGVCVCRRGGPGL